MQRVQLMCVMQDVQQAESKHAHDVNGERQQKQEEVTVVPPPDAVVNPGAMMVKVLKHKQQ